MKQSKVLMGMPITVEILDEQVSVQDFELIFNYFQSIDDRFSTYKESSEISRINRGEIEIAEASEEMKEVFRLAEETKVQTQGYFDIKTPDGKFDPSGLVKGWAIHNAALILEKGGFKNFYVDAGGDVQTAGLNSNGRPWRVGIRNPFNEKEIIKIIYLSTQGIATSGTYVRGQHIYDPLTKEKPKGFVSLTVIGPNVYEADRFATAAFAMGLAGIEFIEKLPGFEGYAINAEGIATATSGFIRYTIEGEGQ